MIVKDEAAVIERCLASVRGLVDAWVVCDTGSSDGTPELIRRTLSDLPGELHSRPWRNFGHNRTEAISLAQGAADYLLLLDADMTVRVARSGIGRLGADSYLVAYSGSLSYRQKLLVRADREWWYEGATHEYLTTSGPETVENIDTLVIDHHADGSSRPEKFRRDVELLNAELERKPDDPRTVFYLAQSYREQGEAERALSLYERRAALGGWDEEVFYSLYQVGALRAQLGDWAQAMADLIRAWQFRPQRLEPVYDLAAGLRTREQYHAAHLFAVRGIDRPQPPDVLFVHPAVYRWGLLFEYSITSYWVADYRASLRACDRLLAMKDLPEPYRVQTLRNREFCVPNVPGARSLIGRATNPAARSSSSRDFGGAR